MIVFGGCKKTEVKLVKIRALGRLLRLEFYVIIIQLITFTIYLSINAINKLATNLI